MRFLRVLGLGRVFARRGRHVAVAEILGDDARAPRDRLGRDIDAVGAHIGDEADRLAADIDALIEALGDLHGARRRKAELARGLLLQGRGGEGRIGVALGRLRFDADDREARLLERRLEGLGLRARADVEARDLLAVGADEARVEGAPAGVRRCATIDQYSRGTNVSISSSRSQTRRSATDCTRPAERAPGSLRHSTGDRLKPTR